MASRARRNTRTVTSVVVPIPSASLADVGLAGVEPATSPLSGVRSNQLSYSPAGGSMVAVRGRRHQPDTRADGEDLPATRSSSDQPDVRDAVSSSRIVTRTPPTRSLIRLNTIAMNTLKATPNTINTMPITALRRKISSPSSCHTW
jgi:hypothetical protein